MRIDEMTEERLKSTDSSATLVLSSSGLVEHDALVALSARYLALYTVKSCFPCAYAKKALELLAAGGLLDIPLLTVTLTKTGVDELGRRGIEVGRYPILILYRNGGIEKFRLGLPEGEKEQSLMELIEWVG
jgi:hypothetical protein